MKTALEKLSDFNKHYSQEVLLAEHYSPGALLGSFKQLIQTTKQAVGEITNTFNTSQKAPAYALGFDKTFIDHNQFKSVFKPLVEQVKEYPYTSYASLKKAKVPAGIELYYVQTLQYLKDFTYKEGLWSELQEYKELLSKLLSQDQSVMRSSITRYSEKMRRHNEPKKDILSKLKTYIKNADTEFVKVSTVLANSSQWQAVYDSAYSINDGFNNDKYDIETINRELKVIGSLIDGIIEDLQNKKEIKGNAIVLSELSNATLELATAVTLRADGITLALDTLGCIHETMSAIVQSQKE